MRLGMTALAERIAPSVTDLIRGDHTKVLGLFHRYKLASNPRKKAALVACIGLAIEVHAQAEEEVFYAALRAAQPALVDKSMPEHEQMRGLIAALREMPPTEEGYDGTFMELMRTVLHHVADEETTLRPLAERLRSAQSWALGARAWRRRRERMGPRARESARGAPRAPRRCPS